MMQQDFRKQKAIKKGAYLLVPFLLFFCAVLFASLWVSQSIMLHSPYSEYLQFLFSGSSVSQESNSDVGSIVIDPLQTDREILEGTFPMPNFGKQWATLNVDGWNEKDIPVFYGDSDDLLKKGAGQAQFSRFCGQNGKVVLSAHVTRHFYEIEDAKARFDKGEEVLVTIDTLWGTYVYRVAEVVIFNYKDISALHAKDGEETLFLYTCYPRENGYSFKTERIGLSCELVSGATWRDYVNAE